MAKKKDLLAEPEPTEPEPTASLTLTAYREVGTGAVAIDELEFDDPDFAIEVAALLSARANEARAEATGAAEASFGDVVYDESAAGAA